MNLGDLRTAMYEQTALSSVADTFDATAALNNAVLEACVRVGLSTKALPTVTLVAGQADYVVAAPTFPADFSRFRRVWLTVPGQQGNLALQRAALDEIIDRRMVSSPAGYGGRWLYTLAGTGQLMLWPTPQGGETIAGVYIAKPTVMSSLTDVPQYVPESFHRRLLVAYACWKACLYDGRPDEAQMYQGEYEAAIEALRAHRNAMMGGRSTQLRRVQSGRHVVDRMDRDTGW